MKSIFSLIISGALVVSGFAQTRNVLVGTNNVVVQPTNFWSADSANARAGLGLGTAATNPASAFQPSSSALSNLASSNAVNLTNLRATNIIGVIPSSNIPTTSLTNIGGTLSITSGGTGATNAGGARTNLGLGATNNVAFNSVATELINYGTNTIIGVANQELYADGIAVLGWNTNSLEANSPIVFGGSNIASTTRTNLGLGSTNNAFSSLSVGQLITNQASASNASSAFGRQIAVGSTVENSFAAGFVLSMSNFPAGGAGGSVVLGGMGTMTNWGAFLFNGVPQGGTAATSRGNSTFAVNASNGIYLNGSIFLEAIQGAATDSGILAIGAGGVISRVMTNKSTATPAFFGWDGFLNTAFSAAQARTNIGLSFAALTNTNTSGFNASLYGSGTNPVLVNTNGEVVSPTNFWQVSPANTRVQISQPVVNATNNATNARNLYLYSLAISTTGVTNTIQLPTNGGTLLGDVATIIHEGPTSSVTAVRQIGSGTNIIAMNQFQEAIKFIYESGGWRLADNISQVEPIYFSGTNASANAAASRTNLGLGATNDVYFQSVIFGTNVASSVAAIDNFGLSIDSDDTNTSVAAISFIGAGADRIAANTRTNLGLGLSALTNTSNTTFQQAIFTTNAAPTNTANVNGIGFNTAVAWMSVSIVTNGVTNSYRIPLFQ